MIVVRDKTRHGNSGKRFDFDLTCDVIGDSEVNNNVLTALHFLHLPSAV